MVHISDIYRTPNVYHMTVHVTRNDCGIAWWTFLLFVLLRPKFMFHITVNLVVLSLQVFVIYVISDLVRLLILS